MTSSQSQSSRLHALTILDAYSKSRETGDQQFKSTMWNLTKARRNKSDGAVSIQASHVREDLRARAVVKERSDDAMRRDYGQFCLVDAFEELEKENNASKIAGGASVSTVSSSTSGLRNRKNTSSSASDVVAESQDKKNSSKNNMMKVEYALTGDERLQRADPLELFGGAFASRDLKAAQQQAKASLESYVRAANLLLLLQQQIPNQDKHE